jgi:hypothetical protein
MVERTPEISSIRNPSSLATLNDKEFMIYADGHLRSGFDDAVSLAADQYRTLMWYYAGAGLMASPSRFQGRFGAPQLTAVTGSSTGQVSYGSSHLSQAAIAYRRANGISGGRNVAVFEYLDSTGSVKTIGKASEMRVGHAERLIAKELESMGVRPTQVTRIYSELAPCNLPGGYCDKFIRETYPQAQVSWSFEYGATQESRKAAMQALKKAVEALIP